MEPVIVDKMWLHRNAFFPFTENLIAQACLSLHLSKYHVVGDHMSWLILENGEYVFFTGGNHIESMIIMPGKQQVI